ncbi:MAG: amidohydrolase family protein, partial [Phycisphaerae bacterium]
MHFALACGVASAQVAVKAKTLHTMGPAGKIDNAVVVVKEGKIAAVGPAASTPVPDGFKVIEAAVVTPGLIDAHCTIGLSGIYNQPHDSDQLERSSPIQPELRAIDAYNPQEALVAYVRGFGVTTIHTGHAWGELVSGQTVIVKTVGNSIDAALVKEPGAIACTLSPAAHKDGGKAPGTRGKTVALLRAELIKAREYADKLAKAEADKKPDRNLRLETLGKVLAGEIPLLVTCHRSQDIASALRLQREFGIKLWLDGAAESYVLIDEIKAAKVPVFIHPTMERMWGERENMSMETATKLRAAGIPVALQGGYESYVPKARVVLFEAAIAAANGLTFEQALGTITTDAARILEIDKRIGSLEVGKDADIACFDGDPFEFTTHCTTVLIDGKVVSDKPQ